MDRRCTDSVSLAAHLRFRRWDRLLLPNRRAEETDRAFLRSAQSMDQHMSAYLYAFGCTWDKTETSSSTRKQASSSHHDSDLRQLGLLAGNAVHGHVKVGQFKGTLEAVLFAEAGGCA
jgi:hypothetical protein